MNCGIFLLSRTNPKHKTMKQIYVAEEVELLFSTQNSVCVLLLMLVFVNASMFQSTVVWSFHKRKHSQMNWCSLWLVCVFSFFFYNFQNCNNDTNILQINYHTLMKDKLINSAATTLNWYQCFVALVSCVWCYLGIQYKLNLWLTTAFLIELKVCDDEIC